MSRGSGYKGSPSVMNSGAGNMEIVPLNSRGKNFSFYKFEFESATKPVTVIINKEQICLKKGEFSIEGSDAPISSFVVVTPNAEFTWIGAYI